MRIGTIPAFGAAASLLVFTLGCYGTVCPTPPNPCAPRPAGQFGYMPTLPQPQSPQCPPSSRTVTDPVRGHRLAGGIVTNSSAVRVMRTRSNTFSTRVSLPSRAGAVSRVPTTVTTSGPAVAAPQGDTPVTATVTVANPVRSSDPTLCAPGDFLGECYTLPEGESPAVADGIDLYVPGVVSAETATAVETPVAVVEDQPEAVADAIKTAVVEDVAEVAEPVQPEVAETPVPAVSIEADADASVTSSIPEPDEVDATVTLLVPEAAVDATVEAPVEVTAPAAVAEAVPAPEEMMAEKAETATLETETAPVAADGRDDQAYLAMPKLPSEMTRERAIVEDRLTSLPSTMSELDGIPMVELPPKLD